MAIGVDFACNEGKSGKQLSNLQKGDHGGFELVCTNPDVCVAETRDRSWSH